MTASEKNIMESELLELARKRVKKIRNFYIHLLIYSVVMVFYVLNAFNLSPFGSVNRYILIFWTLIIVIKAINIFITEVVFGKKWEERNIRKITERLHKNKFDNHGKYE